MEIVSNRLCCGCLSSDRKMKSVNNLSSDSDREFLQILTEIPILMTHAYISWMCWECENRIRNFSTFRNQVKHCALVLQKYVHEDHCPTPKPLSMLDTCTLPIIDLNPDLEHTLSSEAQNCTLLNNTISKTLKKMHIKDDLQESVPNVTQTKLDIEVLCDQVKNETDLSDDDRCLIDIRNDDKYIPNTHKKIRRKNGKLKLKKEFKPYEEIELTPDEVNEERLVMETKEEYVNSVFKCEKCIVPFPNEDDFKDHMLTKHEFHGAKYVCMVCSVTFGSAGSLSAHVRRHTSRRRCSLCAHTSTTERAANMHYTEKHQDSEIYDLAAKAYQSHGNKSQDAEINGSKSDSQFPCEHCEKTFRWKTSLRKHLEKHKIEAGHKRKPYCDTCSLSFTNSSNLRKHVKASSNHQIKLKLRKLNEDLPETTTAQHAKDIESIRSKVNSQREQFPCPQCEKKFQWKGNLLRHLHSHAAKANGELVCGPCSRTFSSIATYNQHMKISMKHVSENEFKYMCSDCGKRFINKIKLRDHINWDHLKKFTHQCTDCQKVFKSHTSLYLHRQVVHKQYRSEHLCDHCGKSFPNKTKLRSHTIALHTLEAPYRCDKCPARFGWHSCLSRHLRRVHRNVHKNTSV